MERIGNREGEITIIYNSEKLEDRQAYSFLKTMEREKLRFIDITKEKLDETQVVELAKRLNVDIPSLVDKNNRLLFHEIENGNLTKGSLVKLLSIRPDFMRTPITMWNGNTEYWDSAYEMIKYQKEFKNN